MKIKKQFCRGIELIVGAHNDPKKTPYRNTIASQHTINPTSYDALGKEWVSSQDVMQLLHISLKSLYRLRANGTLPYSQICRKIFYRTEDIQRVLKNNYKVHTIQHRESNQ